MFGFLRVGGCELGEESSELYRAHFCAGCHALADFGGRTASLLTNYDQTFFVLLLTALEEDRQSPAERTSPIDRRPCTGWPLRSVGVARLSERSRELAAAFTIALVDSKLDDDLADGGLLFERLGRRLAKFALRRRSRRSLDVLAWHGFDTALFEAQFRRQLEAEAAPHPTLAALSSPTADLLGEIFAFAACSLERPECAGALRRIGRSVGRVLYVIDALEDRHRDRERDEFNAIDAVAGSASGEHVPSAVQRFLAEHRAKLENGLRELESAEEGPRAEIFTGVTASLDARTARLSRQRGDCDCFCPADACSGDCPAGDCDCAQCSGPHLICCDCAPCECCYPNEKRRKRRKEREEEDGDDEDDDSGLIE